MTNQRCFHLSLLPNQYVILKLAADAETPKWAANGEFFSVTRTSDELSIVTAFANVPGQMRIESKWRVLKVHGPFALDEVGVLAALAAPLSAAAISIFVISTYDTDYLLINEQQCDAAISALQNEGHRVTSC
ncbi:MAG: ACT domain-containing protein [Candidatus Acidiferrum sp.]